MNERPPKSEFKDTQNIVFTNLGYEHLEQIAELERQCFAMDAWSLELLKGELEDKSKHYFVALEKNIVLAYGGYAQILDEAHIMNIAVKKGYRNMGLAKGIISLLIDDAKKRGIKRATLEVNETNTAAINLYEKFGFKLFGKRKNYYQNTHDALIYWKEL
ncbi:MAG: ribosomal protein S18-alanine N-acetyltransferase [Bacillota bacterium]|jgi:ribosomal-protein-alanine N-acetyltransferase|nr:ribosomal protein S18-alanine N-acetyltransferase [Bacillota bacterium]HHU43628.1 ribosomal protein S18-alanine N-acetyltransferase [Clostridiales bacterium]